MYTQKHYNIMWFAYQTKNITEEEWDVFYKKWCEQEKRRQTRRYPPYDANVHDDQDDINYLTW